MKIFVALFFTLLFVLPVFAQKSAEVTATVTYLRKLPDYESEKIATLPKGAKIFLEKSRQVEGWYFVSTADGQSKGWIRRDAVGQFKDEPKFVKEPEKPKAPEKTKSAPKVSAPPKPEKISAPPIETKTEIPNSSDENKPENTDEDTEVLRIESSEVSLYVRVVGQNNRPVKSLKQSDFKVFEDEISQPVTSLSVAEVPIISALVIDNSRSLRSQLAKVIEAGKVLIGTNKSDDESTIVRFTSAEKIEVMQEFTSQKFLLDNALENMFVEGGQTAIIDAIYKTVQRLEQYKISDKKDDPKLRALILVSDGDNRASKFSEQQLFDLLRRSNVQVYAVGFVNNLSRTPDADGINRQEKSKDFLTKLAQETGGKVYFPASPEDFPAIAAEISGEMRTQYLLSYAPAGESGKSDIRKIRVEITDGENKEKRTAVTRTSRNSSTKQ